MLHVLSRGLVDRRRARCGPCAQSDADEVSWRCALHAVCSTSYLVCAARCVLHIAVRCVLIWATLSTARGRCWTSRTTRCSRAAGWCRCSPAHRGSRGCSSRTPQRQASSSTQRHSHAPCGNLRRIDAIAIVRVRHRCNAVQCNAVLPHGVANRLSSAYIKRS